jgi:hypothetical protein
MAEVELQFWDWCAKVAERLTFMRLNQIEHREINESDYELLKVLYKPYYNGEYVICQTKMEKTDETAVQQGLFTTGMEIETVLSEPKTEEK